MAIAWTPLRFTNTVQVDPAGDPTGISCDLTFEAEDPTHGLGKRKKEITIQVDLPLGSIPAAWKTAMVQAINDELTP